MPDVLLVYIWKKGEIRGSCMNKGRNFMLQRCPTGRNPTVPCTSMCLGSRSWAAGSYGTCLGTGSSPVRRGWIWMSWLWSACPQAPVHSQGPSVSLRCKDMRTRVLASHPTCKAHMKGKGDFSEPRQKGRHFMGFGSACSIWSSFPGVHTGIRLLVKLEWEIWGCKWSETWLDIALLPDDWQSVKEDSGIQWYVLGQL